MLKAFKYRIYPTNAQEQKFLSHLNLCRNLYNCALEERRNSYRQLGKSTSYLIQANYLSEVKDNLPEYKLIHSQVLQDVLKRLDKNFKMFFKRIKLFKLGLLKNKPGKPRFRGKDRYSSFTYPQSGFSLDKNNKLFLSKIGHIKINLHRQIDGKIKTCTISRTPAGKWFACFSCETEKNILPKTNKTIGLDFGLKNFITTSDNEYIKPEKFLKKNLERLAIRKRKYSKKKTIEGRKAIARIYEKIVNSRSDWQHKVANRFIKDYDVIYLEDLNLQDMVEDSKFKSMRRSISDVSWRSFVQKLVYKAEYAGKIVVQIDPRNTSKMCSGCGKIKEDLELYHRIYQCDDCKLEIDRDYNAALNIKDLGLQQLINNQLLEGRLGIDSPIERSRGHHL